MYNYVTVSVECKPGWTVFPNNCYRYFSQTVNYPEAQVKKPTTFAVIIAPFCF
jgi:hypothetical protein